MNDSGIGNFTTDPYLPLYSKEYVIVSSAIYVLIITLSLLGNTLVCLVLLSTKYLRKSVDTCFVLSLAVSDLLTTCLATSFDLEQIILDQPWRHGEIMCNVWSTTYLMAVPTSILSLLALSVHRYLSIKNPLDRLMLSPLMTRGRAIAIIVLLWMYSLLFALVPVFGWKYYPESTSIISGSCFFNISRIYSVLSSAINFLIPVLATCLIHCKIFCLVIESRKLFPRVIHTGGNRSVTTQQGRRYLFAGSSVSGWSPGPPAGSYRWFSLT